MGIVVGVFAVRKLVRSQSRMIPRASGSGAADSLASYGGEDGGKTPLPVGELAGELAAHECGSEIAEGTKGQCIVDCVGDECAFDSVAGLGLEAVAMAKGREGAGELLVSEVAVPDEFGDAGGESDAFGNPANRAEGDEDLRADAGRDACKAASGVLMLGTRGWRGEAGVFNASLEFRGHEVGQVGGVGEEGEDQLDEGWGTHWLVSKWCVMELMVPGNACASG